MGEVLAFSQIDEKILANRKDKKLVFTNGCFDLLHVGHIRYLQQAKALGDVLIVGLNTDASVKKLKGEERPIQNESDRAEILAALSSVDYVVHFGEDTPIKLIEKILPDFLVKGGDYVPQEIVGYDIVTQNGGEVLALDHVDGKSTTSLIS